MKKNFLAGAELPEFSALNTAARIWLDTIANIRIHGETRKRPAELLQEELPHLLPLPQCSYDVATVASVRASSQFRIALDANRYSVPARFTGQLLAVKSYPDRLCLYHDGKLVLKPYLTNSQHLVQMLTVLSTAPTPS